MFRFFAILFGLVVSSSSVRADEEHSVPTALSNTTLSGYVDTSANIFGAGLGLPGLVSPQFDGNSAKISHPFISLRVGSKFVYIGSGGSAGATMTVSVLGEEVVDGVRTVKVVWTQAGEAPITNWFAQDTQGNIWGLKSIDGGVRHEDFLKWPAVMTPGTSYTTEFGERVFVVENGLTITTPFATFQNCVRLRLVREIIPSSVGGYVIIVTPLTTDVETVYLAPGIGVIRSTDHEKGQQMGTMELKTSASIITKPVTVTTTGKGTVSIKNGQLLQVGKVYTATGTAAAGYVFRGWTLPEQSSISKVTFTMQEGMQIAARFEDSAKPVVLVAQPKNNARVQLPEITVSGTARDNEFLAAVRVQLNDGQWTMAGASNWNAAVTLIPGPNKIRVYGEDAVGNRSATNTLTVTYVKSHQFNVTIIGKGSVSPNLNGKLLEVGKTYTVTAVPAAGFRFQTWSGGLEGTTAKKIFTMPDQPVNATAAFIDSAIPTVVITSPKANERVVTNVVRIAGTAKDNMGVAKVRFNVDGTGWIDAAGTTNWTGQAEVGLGSHTVQIYSEDAAGNHSKTNTVVFRVPDYRGIYFGTFSQPFGRGAFGVIVTADQKSLIIAGDTSREQAGSLVVNGIGIGLNGKFDDIVDGAHYFGTFSDSGVSGQFITVQGVRGNFSGTKRAATGIHQNSAGYYEGRFTSPIDEGSVHALLAADGKVLGIDLSDSGAWGEAGSGIVNSQNEFTFATVSAKVIGSLQNNPLRLSGVYRTSVGLGNASVFGQRFWSSRCSSDA